MAGLDNSSIGTYHRLRQNTPEWAGGLGRDIVFVVIIEHGVRNHWLVKHGLRAQAMANLALSDQMI